MFNLGFGEILVLAIIALFVIGPDRLPEAARKLASIINELKRATGDFSKPFDDVKKSASEFVVESQNQIQKQLDKTEEALSLDEKVTRGDDNES